LFVCREAKTSEADRLENPQLETLIRSGPMHKTLIAVLVGAALLFALSVSGGWAGEIAGKIQTVNHSERHLVLADGTQVWVAEGFPIETLKEGALVEGSYEERDGKKIAVNLKVSD